MTRVKLCGITNEADRDAAVAAGADAVGVIVDVPVDTPREVTVDRAAELVAGLPPFVSSVLVTMPNSVQAAMALQREVRADTIQVHGTLPPEYVGGLRSRARVTVVAAVGPDEAVEYADHADAVLVDSVDDAGGGGTGETHDWERTREVVDSVGVPVVLAGGLTPDNVADAVETVGPYAVDTASGVEREGGVKDHDAMAQFVARARAAGAGEAA